VYTHLDNRRAVTRASKLWRHLALVAGITTPVRVLPWTTTWRTNLPWEISSARSACPGQLPGVHSIRPSDNCQEDDQQYNEHHKRCYRRPAAAFAVAEPPVLLAVAILARVVSCIIRLGGFLAYLNPQRLPRVPYRPRLHEHRQYKRSERSLSLETHGHLAQSRCDFKRVYAQALTVPRI
jgi:hypothetical protein